MKKNSAFWALGVLISLTGAICFSTKAIFVKLAYAAYPADAVTLLALRMVVALPFFVIPAIVISGRKENIRLTGRQWIQISVIGCLGYYVSSLLDFIGLQFVSAGMERLVLFTYPTFVLIISAGWLRKKTTSKEWIAVIITYVGLLIAFIGEVRIYQADQHFLLGVLLILTCAITYAIYIVGSGQFIPIIGALKFNSYAMSAAAIGVIGHYLLTNNQSLIELPREVYLYSGMMGILSTVIPSYLVSISINRLGANVTAIIASIGPLSTILQAYIFLDESVTMLQIAGTVFILGGVLLISWRPSVKIPSQA